MEAVFRLRISEGFSPSWWGGMVGCVAEAVCLTLGQEAKDVTRTKG